MSNGRNELLCTACNSRRTCSDGGKGRKGRRFEKEMNDFRAQHQAKCGPGADVAFLGKYMDV